MYIHFDWDDGNAAKCLKHGLTRDEIEFALSNEARVFPDPAHSQTEERFVAISRTPTGHPVFVVFCRRGEKLRPISARYMHAREARRYDAAFGAEDDHG